MSNRYPVIKHDGINMAIGGVYEISNVLGCTKQQIFSLRKRDDFPRPIVELAATPVWDIDEILEFKKNWIRRGTPKPKFVPEAVEVVE